MSGSPKLFTILHFISFRNVSAESLYSQDDIVSSVHGEVNEFPVHVGLIRKVVHELGDQVFGASEFAQFGAWLVVNTLWTVSLPS